MARDVAFRKSKHSRGGKLTILFVVVMLSILVGVKGYDLHVKRMEYKERINKLQSQIDSENERTVELEEYEKYTKTAKYVEEIAKQKLGLVYENEIIFESGVDDKNE